MITRRNFFARLALGTAAIAAAGVNSACWLTGSLFDQILKYVNIGLMAFQAVVVLVPGLNAAAPIVMLVKVGFADLQIAVKDYEAAPDSQKQTLLGKLSTVLADLQQEIQTFWASLQLPDVGLATLIQGLLGLILSTLAGFALKLPAPAQTRKALPANHIAVTPSTRSAKQFQKEFNNTLTAAGKPAVNF